MARSALHPGTRHDRRYASAPPRVRSRTMTFMASAAPEGGSAGRRLALADSRSARRCAASRTACAAASSACAAGRPQGSVSVVLEACAHAARSPSTALSRAGGGVSRAGQHGTRHLVCGWEQSCGG
jgi:hypothetical protein